MAASLAGGVKANFGTMTKPLQVGQSARNGLMTALLAERGYTAAPDALEHRQGFFAVFNGEGHYDAERAIRDWGAPLEIEADTVAIKRFPCCGSAQPAIVLALDIARSLPLKVEDIAAVRIRVPRPGFQHTNRPDPRTALDAKFSVQYAVARALADGDVRLEHFEGNAHADARVRRLLSLTDAAPHPDMDNHGARYWGAEVTVTLKDGRVLTRHVDRASEGADQLSDAKRRAKFMMCATRVLAEPQAAAAWQYLQDLNALADIRALTALLETSGKPLPLAGRG
jgi:2-methylcitrate dehydratase PrpD